MKTLREYIKEAEDKKIAIGHFNISDIAGLKAIFESAKELSFSKPHDSSLMIPVVIGASEGEAEFVGHRQAAALVKSLREEYNFPIFINADHHKSIESIKKAVEAGFDAVLFDGGKLPLEENIKKTKEVVDYVKSVSASWRTDILVEGEIGYIGSGSVILDKIPEGAAVNKEDLTKAEEAARFVKETGVDLLAPAVGNLHGLLSQINADKTQISTDLVQNNADKYKNPPLDIDRIKEIRQAAGIPLVLHGGSGISDNDFTKAINAGVSIIHINTEIRLAWRNGLESALKEKPDEIAPYKILPQAVDEVKKIVDKRLRLFNGMV